MFGFVLVEQIDAHAFRDAPQNLILISGLNQPVQLRKPLADGVQLCLQRSGALHTGALLPHQKLHPQRLTAVLRPHCLAPNVRQDNLHQHLLVDVVGRTGIFAARCVAVADIRLVFRFFFGNLFAVVPHIPHGRSTVHTPKQTTEQGNRTAFPAASSCRVIVHPLYGVTRFL